MTFHPFLLPAAATLAQLLPPLAVIPHWKSTTPARRWVAIWCLAFFASDLLQIAISMSSGPNLWIFIYVEPVEDAILLWFLSHWQTKPVLRIAARVAIPLVIGTYVIIAVMAGEMDTYKTFSGPFRALLIMLWTVYTLLSNLAKSPERVWSRDWLWTTLGILLYFGLLASTEPIVAAMGPEQIESMRRVFYVRALGDVFAFILIWRGMRCPLPNSSSSGST